MRKSDYERMMARKSHSQISERLKRVFLLMEGGNVNDKVQVAGLTKPGKPLVSQDGDGSHTQKL